MVANWCTDALAAHSRLRGFDTFPFMDTRAKYYIHTYEKSFFVMLRKTAYSHPPLLFSFFFMLLRFRRNARSWERERGETVRSC